MYNRIIGKGEEYGFQNVLNQKDKNYIKICLIL